MIFLMEVPTDFALIMWVSGNSNWLRLRLKLGLVDNSCSLGYINRWLPFVAG